MNLYPPHTSHVPGSAGRPSPSTYFFSSPVSLSRRISSAPPKYLPPIKTRGRVSFAFSEWPRILCSSSMNPWSIDRSRSSTTTRKPRKMDRTVLQSSNVERTTRRLVKYTTTRFSAPGKEIDGSDWFWFSNESDFEEGNAWCWAAEAFDSGKGSREEGGEARARRTELASRTRWKTDFLGELVESDAEL